MATEKAPRAPASTPPPPAVTREAIGDIRSGRPYFLTAHPLTSVARRAASIASLILLDMIGLTLGVYAALALRDFVYGDRTVLWGVLWKAETDWLPFLTLVTVLVFWQAGLYAERERRAGFGRVVGSLVLIGVITLIFASWHRPPVLDVRPGPDGDRALGNLHRPAARELRHPHPRRPQAGRSSPQGDPGRRGGESRASPQDARAGSRRDRLRLRRRGRAVSERRRRPAQARAGSKRCPRCLRATTSTS